MDRIANEGIRFDNCYAVNALSRPSRACILTGKFSHENGFTDNASTFNGQEQAFLHDVPSESSTPQLDACPPPSGYIQQYMHDYLATVLSVDENIGRLLNYLEKVGELDNTIIVYTSDQGFFLGEHDWFDKRFMYEECQRMLLVIRYSKAIKAGSTSNAICMNVDFAPTFLDFAGIEIPSDSRSTTNTLQNIQ